MARQSSDGPTPLATFHKVSGGHHRSASLGDTSPDAHHRMESSASIGGRVSSFENLQDNVDNSLLNQDLQDTDATQQSYLDEVEQRADFWCKLVAGSAQPSGRIATRIGASGLDDVRENMLEELFD